ncbi:MAG: tetratricopeptide repeat protein, partial [Pyrinomonadaceae bacterium]
MSSLYRLAIFGILTAVLSIGTAAQDLGSSNKIFSRTKKASKSEKTPENPSPKIKSRTSRTKTASKKDRTESTPGKSSRKESQAASTGKGKFTESKGPPVAVVEISKSKSAVKLPAKISSADADRYEGFIETGNDARDERNYPAAEVAYKQAKAIKPNDSRAIYGLGNLYSDQQRWEEAENAYRDALELGPTNAIANIALSFVLTQPIAAKNLSERYEEAEMLARRAIKLAPSNALAHDQLGVALELRGLIRTETENAYRKAIQLDPSFAPPYAHLGRLLRRRGLNQESAVAYQNAIRHSTDVATMILVADVMQSEQRYAESEQLLRKALASDPRNPSALYLLGRALTTQSKFSDAERVLLTSLTVAPNTYMANSLL